MRREKNPGSRACTGDAIWQLRPGGRPRRLGTSAGSERKGNRAARPPRGPRRPPSSGRVCVRSDARGERATCSVGTTAWEPGDVRARGAPARTAAPAERRAVGREPPRARTPLPGPRWGAPGPDPVREAPAAPTCLERPASACSGAEALTTNGLGPADRLPASRPGTHVERRGQAARRLGEDLEGRCGDLTEHGGRPRVRPARR